MNKINPNDYTSPLQCLLNNPESYKAERFKEASQMVREGLTMHVACNGVWSASKPGAHVHSYEKIGYHSGANWILEGFLREGGKVVFHGFKGIDGEVSLTY